MRFVAAVRAFRVVMRTRRITSIARSRALLAKWPIDLFPRPARGHTVCMGSLSSCKTRCPFCRSELFMAGLQEARDLLMTAQVQSRRQPRGDGPWRHRSAFDSNETLVPLRDTYSRILVYLYTVKEWEDPQRNHKTACVG
jgi:hypothetical protein